eukprot:1153685-Pelagomonas_calceolata.AAC.1
MESTSVCDNIQCSATFMQLLQQQWPEAAGTAQPQPQWPKQADAAQPQVSHGESDCAAFPLAFLMALLPCCWIAVAPHCDACHFAVSGSWCMGERAIKGKGNMKTFFLYPPSKPWACGNLPLDSGHLKGLRLTGRHPGRSSLRDMHDLECVVEGQALV